MSRIAGTQDDLVRWFNSIGACEKCGKPAHGWLMNAHNAPISAHCTKCAEARLNRATKAREKAGKNAPS